jgi:hypothetical protein
MPLLPGNPGPPQQSVSRWQRSPTVRHALEGWQTGIPVGA